MTRLKSIYISLYITLLVASAVLSIVNLIRGGWDVGWLGVALTCIPFLTFLLAITVLQNTSRTSRYLWPFLILVILGGVLATAGFVTERTSLEPVIVSAVLAATFFLYVFWYSVLERPDARLLAVGQPLKEFQLKTPDGRTISSRDYLGGHALFMFYRGNWCPLCMAQIKQVAASYRELAERGVKVILVSPQPERYTAGLARKFDVPMEFLVDKEHRASDALGITSKGALPAGLQLLGYDSDTVLPTVLIVDAKGTIVFSDQTDNYRLRPEPETYLRILDGSGA